MRIGRVTFQLLRRLDQSTRMEVMRDAIPIGRGTSTIVHRVLVLGQQQGKYGDRQPDPEDKWLLSSDQLRELEGLALEKVRKEARSGRLFNAPDLGLILGVWKDWAGNEEVREWVRTVTGDDMALVEFLEKFLQKALSQALTDVVSRAHYRLDSQWLEPYLEVTQVVNRGRVLRETGSLTDNQKMAIDQFLREYELRKQGKNPNSPFALEE